MASQLDKLMDGRGLTLRSKSRRRPQISAPKPISGPTPSAERRPSAAQQGGATSDLVKRRYSSRFNQVPDSTFDSPPVPTLPDIQAFNKGPAGAPPIPNGIQPGPGVPLEVNLKALRDPSLPVEKCKSWIALSLPSQISKLTCFLQTSPDCLPMLPKRRSGITSRIYGRSRIAHQSICNKMYIKTEPNLSKLARKQKN